METFGTSPLVWIAWPTGPISRYAAGDEAAGGEILASSAQPVELTTPRGGPGEPGRGKYFGSVVFLGMTAEPPKRNISREDLDARIWRTPMRTVAREYESRGRGPCDSHLRCSLSRAHRPRALGPAR